MLEKHLIIPEYYQLRFLITRCLIFESCFMMMICSY